SYPKTKKGIGLWGRPGTGKTHLLCAALQHLTLERGIPCRYVEVSFLFSEIREAFNRQISALVAVGPLAEVELLAIDEIGKGRGSDFEKDTLDELLGRRYNADRTTLFATNCPIAFQPIAQSDGFARPAEVAREAAASQELRQKIGDRSFSRLAEMTDILQVEGTDRRQPVG
ncbi:MAG: ATP-binding protein, partial [Deltaproteobacteria bacterium]